MRAGPAVDLRRCTRTVSPQRVFELAAGKTVDLRRCTRTVSPLRALNSKLETPMTYEDEREQDTQQELRSRM